MQAAPNLNRTLRPGELAPVSGVYSAIHQGHRPAHDVVVLRGERLPACRQCKGAVHFEVVQAVGHVTQDWDFAGPDPELFGEKAS